MGKKGVETVPFPGEEKGKKRSRAFTGKNTSKNTSPLSLNDQGFHFISRYRGAAGLVFGPQDFRSFNLPLP